MKFEYPEIRISKFAVEDVITVSGELGENETPGVGGNDWD